MRYLREPLFLSFCFESVRRDPCPKRFAGSRSKLRDVKGRTKRLHLRITQLSCKGAYQRSQSHHYPLHLTRTGSHYYHTANGLLLRNPLRSLYGLPYEKCTGKKKKKKGVCCFKFNPLNAQEPFLFVSL